VLVCQVASLVGSVTYANTADGGRAISSSTVRSFRPSSVSDRPEPTAPNIAACRPSLS
jgi:hypothetical protein